MANNDIFNFYVPSDYLEFVLKERQKKRPKYSLSQFAKVLKFPDVGSLSRLLNGHRALSMERAVTISDQLGLSQNERLYFYQMVALQEVSADLRDPLLKRMSLANQDKQVPMAELGENQANLISDYRYFSVRECLRLKNPERLEENFQQVWKASKTVPDFFETMETLKKSGLVEKHPKAWIPNDPVALKVDPGAASAAVRSYHLGWLDVAKDAVHNVSAEKRNFQGTTLSVPKWAYAEVVEQVQTLHRNILKLSLSQDADQVLHVGSFVVPVGEAHEN